VSSKKKNLEQVLGDIIRSRRESLGLSQETLAFECGLHRTYISQLERGQKSPTLRVLFLIANALEMPPDEIVRLAHATLKK
jgi:transcriptional regulator with XRE-family HTH domain